MPQTAPPVLIPVTGLTAPVGVGGDEKGVVVVIIGTENRPPAAYAAVCQRLHVAGLRTVVIGFDERLSTKSVVGILDELGVGWAVLMGDRAGADLAWELAARELGRFVGLVVVDHGHPRVPNPVGVVRDPDCPPVTIATTVLTGHDSAHAVALESQRYVHADYRVVEFDQAHVVGESVAQLAAELVLRVNSW